MRRLRLSALCTVVVYSLFVPVLGHEQAGQDQASGSGVEQQIDRLTQQMVQAQLHGNPSAYEQHYADNAVTTDAAATCLPSLGDCKPESGAVKYDSYDVRDEKIHVYGDAAVVELLASAKGTFKGKPLIRTSASRASGCGRRATGRWSCSRRRALRLPVPETRRASASHHRACGAQRRTRRRVQRGV